MDFIYGVIFAFAVSLYFYRRNAAKAQTETPKTVQEPVKPKCCYCGIPVNKDYEYCIYCDYPEDALGIFGKEAAPKPVKEEAKTSDENSKWPTIKEILENRTPTNGFKKSPELNLCPAIEVIEQTDKQFFDKVVADLEKEVERDLSTKPNEEIISPEKIVGKWKNKLSGQILTVARGYSGGWKYEKDEYSWRICGNELQLDGFSVRCKGRRHIGNISIHGNTLKIKWGNETKEYTKVVEKVIEEISTIAGTWKAMGNSDLMITDTQFIYLGGQKSSYNYSIAMDNVILTSASADNRTHHGKFKYENGELTLIWGNTIIKYRRA
jgi:hypothetical protein